MNPSPSNVPPDGPHPPAFDTAAKWLAKRDRGFTPAEASEFAQWAADPPHAAAIAELETTWSALDQLSALRPPGAPSSPDPDLLLPRRKPRRIYWLRPFLLSAGVAAAIAFFVWSGTRTRSTSSPREPVLFETAIGDERVVELDDGSRVQLNTNSAVEIHFSTAVRQVLLRRGEIFCAVSKDPRRPFVVNTEGISVKAVGTAFDVLRKSDRIEVVVTEGTVGLAADAQKNQTEPRLLQAGTQAVAPIGGKQEAFVFAPLPAEEAARRLAWREHQLDFKESSLAEVALEFNRYNTQQLIIADSDTGAVMIGGRFSPNNLDGFIRLLESSFGIAAERPDLHTVVLSKKH